MYLTFATFQNRVSSSKAFEILSRQDKNNYFGKINRGKKNESEWTHTHLFVSGIDGILTGQNKHFWCSLCRKTRQDNDRSYTSVRELSKIQIIKF